MGYHRLAGWSCKRAFLFIALLAGGNAFGQAQLSSPGFNPTGSPSNGFLLFGSGGGAYGWRAMTSADVINAWTGTCNSSSVLAGNGVCVTVSSTATGVIGPNDGTATPSATTVRGANGLGTNIAGGALTIGSGLGTGNANAGDIIFQTAPIGSSGTTPQTATTYLRIIGGTAGFPGNIQAENAAEFLSKPGAVLRGRWGSPNWDSSYVMMQNASKTESQANAGFAQDSNGLTTVNSSTGQPLNLAVNGVTEASITPAGILLAAVSNGLTFKAGSNARTGTGTLSGGTLAVANTSITANSQVFVQDTGGGVLANIGALYVASQTAGTGFTVTSSNALDTSTFRYWVYETN